MKARGWRFEMPFPHYRRLIARPLKELGQRLLIAVKPAPVIDHAIAVAVLAGKNDRPARGANAIRTEAVVESHPFTGKAVDIGRPVDLAAISTNRMRCMIVTHDEQDVRARPFWFGTS